jgi:hypothetical protein
MLPDMERKTISGGNTDTDLLATIQLKLYTHAGWSVAGD